MIPGADSEGIWLSVVAPAYNEAEGIDAVLRAWNAYLDLRPERSEIVITDDGSRDGTSEILDRLARRQDRLRVVHFPENRGYGAALKAAVAASRGEWVLTMDSDGQFDIRDLAILEREAIASDTQPALVSGARRRKKGRWIHRVADRMLRWGIRAAFHVPLSDPNCAMRLWQGRVVRALEVESTGFAAPTEMVVTATRCGCVCREVPITHLDRSAGETKLNALVESVRVFILILKLCRRGSPRLRPRVQRRSSRGGKH